MAKATSIFDDYMTKEQFCAAVPGGIKPRTADRWASMRKGPARIRVGNTVFYPRTAVAEWLKREREKAEQTFAACA